MKILFLSFVLLPSLILSQDVAVPKQETEKTFVELSKKNRIIAGSKAAGKIAYVGCCGIFTAGCLAMAIVCFHDLFAQPNNKIYRDYDANKTKRIVMVGLLCGIVTGFCTWYMGKRIPEDFKKAYYGKEELASLP